MPEDIDHLGKVFNDFNIGDSRDEAMGTSKPRGSFDADEFLAAESDGGEEDGGVKL